MPSLQTSPHALVDVLVPFLPMIRARRAGVPEWIAALAAKVLPKLEADKGAKEALSALEESPGDADLRAAVRVALRRLFAADAAFDSEVARLLGPRNLPVPADAGGVDVLDPSDETLRRLELVRLLRRGVPAGEVARRFKTDPGTVLHLSAAFTAQGVLGLAEGPRARRWFEQLDRHDPLLRRLEMVRLARSGVPTAIVAAEFDAVPEYVEGLVKDFAAEGSGGLVSEVEVRRFEKLHPPDLRLATYNLHGIHDGADDRYRLIARELADFAPDFVAFQEVINGAAIRDTSAQIAERMSAMVGADYRSFYAHCHLYLEKFPEGVALVSRHPFGRTACIDLNTGLAGGVKPTMPRFAAAFLCEARGRRIAFASTHLDHAADPAVRGAQAQKLVVELERLYPEATLFVVAGDMNDVQGSPAVAHFEEHGYVDAYRACHPKGGNTYTTSEPRSRIDFILVKGANQLVSAETALAHPSLSDHLGVLAVVR